MFRKTSVNGARCIFGDFNARLGHALPGEETTMGEHAFGNRSTHIESGSNRALLLEFCAAHSLVIGNTFCNCAHEDRATYRHIGTSIAEPISERTHLQLDLGIFPQDFVNEVVFIRSDRREPLASHHFVVVSQLNVALADVHKRADRPLLND